MMVDCYYTCHNSAFCFLDLLLQKSIQVILNQHNCGYLVGGGLQIIYERIAISLSRTHFVKFQEILSDKPAALTPMFFFFKKLIA